MSTPYRDGGGGGECPRCGEALGDTHGCGEWIGIVAFDGMPLDELGKFDQVKPLRAVPEPAECPVCKRVMQPRFWSDALFDVCIDHGVWVDDEHRAPFHGRLEILRQQNVELDELAARLETADGRRELARRILALERRIARLEVR